MSVRFIKSAVSPDDYPLNPAREVVFVGRSNAGKSSLINYFSKSQVAKTSKTPGKTTTLNFFSVNGKGMLVDVPGYGFASRSGKDVRNWQGMMEAYFSVRSQVSCAFLLMDIRRDWTVDEENLVDFLGMVGVPVVLILTKSDKVKKNELRHVMANQAEMQGIAKIICVSTLQKIGFEQLTEEIHHWLN